MNAYGLIIALSCVIIFSHIFNYISKRTNIPSVILLILLGIGIKFGMDYYDYDPGTLIGGTLEVLGIIGLIMIVLEAAIDLELSREKWPIIWKSFLVALISLVSCAFIISFIINQFYQEDPIVSLVYAIPLSIVSSAIVIPSVGGLVGDKKEFMIYEGTFSDILGIMFFYFVVENVDAESANQVVYNIVGNIVLTVVISIVISYALILLFQRLEGDVKLFMLIAVLILMYAIGKQLHLSSLVVILTFGLLLNNSQLFFIGKLKEFLDQRVIKGILKDLHLVTRESAFVVRTFFFVVFGYTIDITGLLNLQILALGLGITAVFFIIRFLLLRLFFIKQSILPELFITPRGLITILLFFSIPEELTSDLFQNDVILIVIVATGIIMTWGLIRYGTKSRKELTQDVENFQSGNLSYFLQREPGKEAKMSTLKTDIPKKVEDSLSDDNISLSMDADEIQDAADAQDENKSKDQ
jgi:NhaP-type Na+/H+ or K+/H+ antiporter